MVLLDYIREIERMLNEMMPWMYWKSELLLFYISFFTFLTFIAIVNLKKGSNSRIGVLRMPLTLGDRVFISIALFIVTMLLMNALNLPLYLILLFSSLVSIFFFWRG